MREYTGKTELESLLGQISNNKLVQTNEDYLQKAFDNVAILLLNKSILVSGTSRYSIREIEFYFYGADYKHADPYTHAYWAKNPKEHRQAKFGEWYIHRYSSDTCRTSKRLGLDLTFGNSECNNYGGILLRILENSDGPINGICNIVKEHIAIDLSWEVLGNVAIADKKSVFDESSPLHLHVENDFLVNTPINKSKRELKKDNCEDSSGTFYNKKYRYFNYPDIEKIWPTNS